MAAIREEYILADRFSASFTRLLGFLDRTDAASRAAAQGQQRLEQASGGGASAMVRLAEAALDVAERMGAAGDQAGEMAKATTQAADASERAVMYQERVNASMRRGASAASGLENRLLSLAKAYASVRTAQAFVGMTDTFTQTTARLDRMNDGLQTTAELQEMVYQAAQRSRGVYQETADLVSKLGTMAPEAFNSSGELVAFAEQLNKQFALAGTSTQGAQAAMLQLTQAMSSGVLRGEELNSVLEQAPTITQAIAKYLDVNIGQLREMASEGAITADVVKAALFSTAEETNAAFENVPLTFSQVWTMAGNAATRALEPAMKRLNGLLNSELGQNAVNGLIAGFELLGRVAAGAVDLLAAGVQWVADNWDLITAVLMGVGAAALMAGGNMAMAALQSGIAWAAANWPLLLVVAGVALIIYMARQMGATWEEIGGVVGGVFGLMYAFAMNKFIIPGHNAFAYLGNFVGNFLKDPISSIKLLFIDMATFVLGKVSDVAHGMENLINKIPGMSVDLTSGIDSLYNKVKSAGQTVRDKMGWTEYFESWDYVNYADAWNSWSKKGADIGHALDNFAITDVLGGYAQSSIDRTNFMANSGIPGKLDEIGNDTAAIKRSVSLAEEDMKLLVDMAERQYVNNINLTAQTPVINVTGQNTGDTEMDRRSLANAIRDIIIEEAASHTDMSYR